MMDGTRRWRGPSSRPRSRAGVVSAGLLLMLPAVASGQEERPLEDGLVGRNGRSVVSLRETAATLTRAGTENRDPVSLLAAAQLLLLLEQSQDGVVERLGPREEDLGSSDLESPRTLLRRAAALALERGDRGSVVRAAALAGHSELGAGDRVLRDEILGELRKHPVPRGAVGGPVRREGRLAAGDTVVYRLRFQGGELPNGIYVDATNPFADLDCSVSSGGQEIMADVAPTEGCFLAWKQSEAEELLVEIRHAGEPTYYVLVSN